MPGEAIIGKVAVKVVPDTTDFKEKLKADLEKIEHELRDLEVKITPKIDDSQIVEEARKAKALAEKELGNVNLRVDLDNADSVRRNLNQLEAQLARLHETTEIEVDMQNMDEVMTAIELLETQGIGVELRVDESDPASIEAALKKLDAEIKAIADKAIEPIKLHLDEDELRAERERLQVELDHLNALEINVQFDLDRDARNRLMAEANASIAIIQAQIDALDVSMDVDPDTVAAVKRQIEQEMLKLNDLQIKMVAELDPISKRKLQLEIEELQAKIHDLTVKLNPDVDTTASRISAAELAVLARDRIVKLRPIVDNGATRTLLTALNRLSGHRQGLAWLKDIGEFLSNLDLALPRIALLSTAFFGLAAAVTSGSGALFVLAQQLATIASGAALAGPGFLASLIVSFLVLKTAMSDWKKELPDIAKEWSSLSAIIKKNFWTDDVKNQIRSGFEDIFPQLKAGIAELSGSLGKFIGTFADSLGRFLNEGGRLKGMFDNTRDGIDALTGHTDAFAKIIGILGTAGSKFFAKFLTDIGNASEKWAAWLETAEKTGKLQQIIDNAWQSLINFFRVIGNIVQIFDALGDAARKAFGDDLLGKWADSLDRIEKIMHGPVFQKEMSEVFIAARDAMHNISEEAGPALGQAFKNLGDAVETIFPKVGTTIGAVLGGIADAFNTPRFQDGLQNFVGSIETFATTIRPAFDDIGTAVGAVLDLLSTFVTASAPYAQDALTLWSNVITTLADGIRPFVEQLVPAVGNLFNAIAPSIQKIADAIAGFFSGGGGDAIIQFIKDITPGAEKLAGFIADLAKAFFDWLNVNGSDILTTWADWFNSFADWVDKHKDTILAFFNGFLDVIKLLITNLPTFLGLMGALIALNVLSAATNIGKLSLALDGLAAIIRNWPTALLLFGLFEFLTANSKDDGPIGWLGRLRDSLKDIMSFLSPDLANGANGGWDGTVLEDLGKALDAIAGGIKAMGDAAGNALGPLGLLWDLIKNGFQADDSKPAPAEPPTPMTPPPAIPDSNGNYYNPIPRPNQFDGHAYPSPEDMQKAQERFDQLQQLYNDFQNGLIKKGDESSDTLAQQLGDLFNQYQGHFSDDLPPMGANWHDFWDKIEGDLSQKFGPEIGHQLRTMFEGMQGDLDNWGALFGGDWSNLWDGLLTDQLGSNGQMGAQLGITLAGMQQNLGAFGPQFTTQFASMWQTANQIGGEQGAIMQQNLVQMLSGMNGSVQTGMSQINGSWATGWGGLSGGMSPGISAAITLAGGIPGRILAAIGNVSSLLYGTGQSLMDGLSAGIQSKTKSVAASAASVVYASITAARNAAQVASPSKVFIEIGKYLSQGLAIGIEKHGHEAVKAMTGVVGDLTGVADGYSGVSAAVSAAANRSMVAPGDTYNSNRTLNYYAAPGSSISSEDDLFKAAARARMGW